ncbi:response regulator transcription factor [Cohnella massiliensis]|uniref:response regulator transcription factor n=1 Tax=Cohnella massiliensis TaxID=1816691 RepID=UPI0009BB0490|nr:response regulator transcription factor [Cohnella massiliensis]
MQRILIIEDDTSIAELQRDYLEIGGYSVKMEHTGDGGLREALNGRYDLVILDLMLPGMDGFEICRRLRAEREIPIIMLSARTEDIDKIRGLGLGADDYMTKPFSPGELVARVKAHLSRYERLAKPAESRRAEIAIRGLKIDKNARRVFVNGDEILLTTKEFDLLAFLAEHPNRVFHKEELFEKVWGLEANGDSSTVTVHIRKIREKLESVPASPSYIDTVWGAGYRFKVD